MDRTFESGAAGSPPSAPASPSSGYPTAGNPSLAVPATKPGPWWYHMMTEELRAVIVAAGLTPDHTDVAQLSQAIDALILSATSSVDLSGYAPINNPVFTGVPTAPTAVPGTSTVQLANTEFVAAAVAASHQLVQSVTAKLVTAFSTTSTSFVSTGLAVTITPQYADSRIILNVAGDASTSGGSNIGTFSIYRGATNLGRAEGITKIGSYNYINCGCDMQIEDEPGVTTPVTYTVYAKGDGGTNIQLAPFGIATIRADEVK